MLAETMAYTLVLYDRSKRVVEAKLWPPFWISWRVEPQFLTFEDPRHRLHRIDSLWEINSALELLLGGIDFMWRSWRFQNCHCYTIYIYCVWMKDIPIEQHISNTQTIRQLSAGDKKSILALKLIFMEHVRLNLNSYLIPTQFQSPYL